jgi:arabinose-5-phosphate isomerase
MSPLDTPIGQRLRQSAQRTVELEASGLQALRRALAEDLGGNLVAAVQMVLRRKGRCVVTGMGKSGHVARKIAATLASTGTAALYVHPGEASHGDLGMIMAEDAILALSWSGDTPELATIIAYARRFDVSLIGITSRAESQLGSAADYPLILPTAVEACPNGLAPTTSTTMQMALGDAFAMCLLEARGFSASDFRVFHPGGKLGAQLLRAADLMQGGDNLPLLGATALLSEAIVAMTSRRSGIGGVVSWEGELLGVITDGDIRRAFHQGFIDRPVTEVMTATPTIAHPESLAPDLVTVMNTRAITSMFVVDQGKPIGILHLHDLLRAGVV